MILRVCITTMIPELAYDAANLAIDNANGEIRVMIAANMCSIDRSRIHPCEGLYVEEYADNEGVVQPMHNLWRATHHWAPCAEGRQDILVFIHDDCQILEKGWDDRIRNVMESQPLCDCIGLVGGTGIGAHDIYQTPYELIQLARHNVQSALVDAEVHGHRASGPMLLATADGCALIVRRSFMDTLGGWNWWPEANHGYDNALACMLRRHGRQLWLVPIKFAHPSLLKLYGGHKNDAAAARYGERFGDCYTRAHRALYDMFRDVLPFHVSGP